ncbi:LPS export ABC transporter periplasmic protein LptC [Trichlorobacter lovleyi]|uniref:LPS export ABC transporter periplasmic protein LptC n=1 Tax=Trichlorobacter lovleyi TaxID=313985 RepID=UPI002240526E|nr:LPS export ABC transporter periplasmic protein LptC [Trichlorobacter lovleyi]QOX79222.1 LPS export ABC transporter periplasmic protein LptC [Trichlorobacter lovleyi]
MQMPSTRRIRQVLAVVIVTTSVALVAAILFRQFRSTPPETASKPISPEIDMSISRLNFSEMRGNDKLWDLTAERADYDKETGTAKLAGVKTEIFGGKAGGLIITSETGSYLEEQHLVTMQKNVRAVTRKGMTFTTEQLEYRSVPGLVVSNHPVKVVDGRLTLTAQGMEMSLHDEKARFRGSVEAVVEGIHGKN